MSLFKQSPEFKKDLSRLEKKYRSLARDLQKFERLVEASPLGFGKNFTVIHTSPGMYVVKYRLPCGSLRDRSMRLIYIYQDNIVTFLYIELYFKGDKANEDRERITRYLKSIE